MNRRQFLATLGTVGASLVATPSFAKPGTSSFMITAATGTAPILGKGNPATHVWHYNRLVPGPALRIQQGQPVDIRFVNKLPQASTLHWHGLRIDNAMDGVPELTQKAVASGKSYRYQFTPPDAGTYWYHPHNRTWEQLARGLYGVVIVEEATPPETDQDLVLVIDDWLIQQDGQIHEQSFGALHDWAHGGRQGNWLTVNGKPSEQFPVKTGERLRLRLINVANSRIMPLQFNGVTPHIVAIDGQPVVPTTAPNNVLIMAPGQRFDLMVDMTQDPGSTASLNFVNGKEPYEITRFVYDKQRERRKSPLAESIRLPDNPLNRRLDLDNAKTVELLMQGGAMGGMRGAIYKGKELGFRELAQQQKLWALNGVADLPEKPLLRVTRGQSVIINMINDNSWPHAMHLHGHHFSLLQNNQPGSAWRDTTLIERGETQQLAFVADNPGKWLLHCHMVEHTAAGMLTWIEVV